MEFRIVDRDVLGGERIVAWVVCRWPETKRDGLGGIVCKRALNAEPRRQVSLGHVPKVLRNR
jgi:hypothetical protein